MDTSGLTVLRGARGRYSFSVDGPYAVEDEDLPPEVAGVVLGLRHLYSILAESSSVSEIPHAVRFARRLAQRLDGVVLDQQLDAAWTRSSSRRVAKPQRGERVATVDVSWYCLRDQLTPDAARCYLDTAARYLPEALPRRFGGYEPLQGKYAESGVAGFIGAWQEETILLSFAGSGPVVDGHLAALEGSVVSWPFWSMGLHLLASPLSDPRWRVALRRVVSDLADSLPAFFASVQVTHGHLWSGRSLWADGQTEEAISPLRWREGWLGLPPTPVWWAWFGEPYLEVVSEALALMPTTATHRGILYEASDEPADRTSPGTQISELLPPDLFARLAQSPSNFRPSPLIPATTIPRVLLRNS